MRTLSIVYTCALLIGIQSCKSQTKNVIVPKDKSTGISWHDTLNKPNYNVKVNKEFDSKGNLIRYDSTYSYSYGRVTSLKDSLFPFKDHFGTQPFDLFKNTKSKMFPDDSLFRNIFFGDDFFKKQSEFNKLFFDEFYPKTDSLKNRPIGYPYFRPGSKTI